jgi:integrase
MASVTRKVGNSGKLSPYWRAKFKGPDARTTVWLTTKCRDAKKALEIAQLWEHAAHLAAGWELNQSLAQKLVRDVSRIYPHPDTLDITRRLVDEMLRDTIGSELAGQNFEQFAQNWLESQKVSTKLATYSKYKNVTNRFLEFLPERRRVASVASISPGEIQRFHDGEFRDGKSGKYVETELVIISSLFNTALNQAIISANPVKAVKRIQSFSEERVPFSGDQIRDLLAVADDQWRGAILISAHHGLRLGDCTSLTWANVDLQNKTLTFEDQKTSAKKQPTKRKTVVCLHADVVAYLDALPVGDDPNAALFPSLCGQAAGGTKGLSSSFKKLMAKANVRSPLGVEKTGAGRQFRKLTFHSLRHTCISRLANAGIGADTRKEMVGHSSGSDEVHCRYVHMGLDLQRDAVSKMPSLL